MKLTMQRILVLPPFGVSPKPMTINYPQHSALTRPMEQTACPSM